MRLAAGGERGVILQGVATAVASPLVQKLPCRDMGYGLHFQRYPSANRWFCGALAVGRLPGLSVGMERLAMGAHFGPFFA